MSCDFSVLWRTRERAIQSKLFDIAEECLNALVERASIKYFAVYGPNDDSIIGDEGKEYISRAVSNTDDVRKICARLEANNGDYYYSKGDMKRASICYRAAFASNPHSYKALVKYALLKAGRPGSLLRTFVVKNKRIQLGDCKTENLVS